MRNLPSIEKVRFKVSDTIWGLAWNSVRIDVDGPSWALALTEISGNTQTHIRARVRESIRSKVTDHLKRL